MRPTRLFQNRLRDSSALIITAGLHIGVAAIALVAVTVAVPTPKPPIIVVAVPDTIVPPPQTPDPRITDQKVMVTAPEPVFTIADPQPPRPWADTRPSEPPIAGPMTPITIEPSATTDPVPRGPSRAARFDPRHAADLQPPYPPAARRLGEEGSVIVHITIGRDGRVQTATIAQSSGSSRLDEAAIAQALKRWRFTPALADGEPVEATRDITVRFRLAEA